MNTAQAILMKHDLIMEWKLPLICRLMKEEPHGLGLVLNYEFEIVRLDFEENVCCAKELQIVDLCRCENLQQAQEAWRLVMNRLYNIGEGK